MLHSNMATINENAAENEESGSNQRQYGNNRQEAIGNENDSGDEASYSSTTSMDSMADLRARSQKARNITEKRRRDKLNMYINQLAALLPSEDLHRMDKSSILKQGVEYLKEYNSSLDGSNKGGLKGSSFLSADELGELMMEAFEGIVLVIDECGLIKYVAEHVNTVFGIEPGKLIGQSMETLVHSEDLCNVLNKMRKLVPEGVATGIKQLNVSDFVNSAEQKSQQRTKQFVQCSFRLVPGDLDGTSCREICCKGFWIDRKFTEQDREQTENLLVLLAMPKDHDNLRELSYPRPLTFSSRHGMDGKFLFVDSSCTRVTGYLPYELLNTSLYFYVHEADLDELTNAHTSLTTVVDVGSILVFFQFRSKSDQWLLMKVILRVTYNPMTSKPEYFNANLSLATQNEILQYKKLKLSNAEDKKRGPGTLTPSNSSVLLSSLVRGNQKQRKSRTPVSARKEPNSSVSSSSESCNKESERQPSPREGPVSTCGETSASPIFPGEAQFSDSQISQKGMGDIGYKASEAQLHAQLNDKIGSLSLSIKKQKSQLEKIHSMMMELRPKMFSSDGLVKQQAQEQQIFDYISSTLAEQKNQCSKLKVTLEGKIRISETKRRAIELRGKARLHSASTASLGQPPSAGSMSSFSGKEQRPRSVLSCSDGESFQGSSCVESHLSTQMFSGIQPPLAEKKMGNNLREEALLNRRSESYENFDDQEQQSLQRQLQQLQHQQDVLNAQGMALAAQGTISRGQLEFVQALMQQQKSLLPGAVSLSPGHVQSDPAAVPNSMQSSAFERLNQQQHNQKILNSVQFQGQQTDDSQRNFYNQSRALSINKLLQNNLTSETPGDSLPYQVLSQLQNLQQELQLQMQMLGRQESQGGAQQSEGVAKVIAALQQLQQMQIRLLQDAIPDKGVMSPDTDCYTPGSTSETVICPQYPPISLSQPYGNRSFSPDTNSRSQLLTTQGHLGDNRRLFLSTSSAGQASPQMLSTNVSRDSQQLNAAPRHSFPEYPSYPRFSSPDSLASFPSPTVIDTRPNNNVRNMMLGNSDGNENSSEAKGKKLADDDNLYQYVDSLPGQTQQLMQLHQAQRMHIVRCQHQQLQALQQQQEQQKQQQQQQQQHQQQQQQQQQHQQQQQQLREEHVAKQHMQQQQHQQQLQQHQTMNQSRAGEASTSSLADTSQIGLNYTRELSATGTSSDLESNGTPSLNQWQTDLQADQVSSMSDLDLFELLSGQAAMSLTEADEQVLDLLIAEGGDMFSL